MSRSPADPRSTFGPAAERYAASAVHRNPQALEKLVGLVKPSNGRILDIATGSGHTALAFASWVDEVIATDLTLQMLQVCRREAESRKLSNMSFCLAEAEILPFRGEAFDGVSCRLAPHHFSRVERFVAEVHRVLKPGGWFLLVDTTGPEDFEASRGVDQVETLRDPSHVHDLSMSEWSQLLKSQGFKVRAEIEARKTLELEDWIERTATPPDAAEAVRALINGSTGELRAYFEPKSEGGIAFFNLREGTFLADK